MMIQPDFLKEGDCVALIAPAGHQPNDSIEAVRDCIASYGLIPKVYPSCYLEYGYLSGPDKLRAKDINDAFEDTSVAAILCIRGGYGCHRLIDMIDWDIVKKSPKFLYGYSDITALHNELQRRCNFMSWHAPMPGIEWINGLDEFTENSLRLALFGPFPDSISNDDDNLLNIISHGESEGILSGGNLTLLVATLGTPYEIDTKEKILFIEDVHETPRNVDRKLLQMSHSGKFRECNGVIIGSFAHCTAPEHSKSLTLDEIFQEFFCDMKVPVLSKLQCGHAMPTLSLPLGARIRINTSRNEITVIK